MGDSPLSRRAFLQCAGTVTAAGAACAVSAPALGSEGGESQGPKDPMGVLVDLTLCVGCRRCEEACKKANGIPPGPDERYNDQSVFAHMRRPAPDAFTVVNAYPDAQAVGGHVYAKVNCLHCNHPSCVSACIVGAMRKRDDGAVTYDAWKCIGCRYCMTACPFQIPAYEYNDALAPRVRKCQFCFPRISKGERPGCVAACPREALLFGKRAALLQIAHARLKDQPGRYINHIYGEHEVGGTSWMYLSGIPFEQAGFLSLGTAAPPALTEEIQHSVFKKGLPPLALYGLLGAMMWYTGRRQEAQKVQEEESAGADHAPPAVPELEPLTVGAEAGEDLAMVVGAQDDPPGVTSSISPAQVALVAPPSAAIQVAHGHGDVKNSASDAPAENHGYGGHHPQPRPVARKLLTPGVWILLTLAGIGLLAIARRFLLGLGAATNLDQQHPWGLWIAVDVASGVALAAGGFTSAFLAHVIHRDHYHAITRPALLTAMLGYTFVVLGLQADLGRFYNVWHPLFMWQGNSVLFEVGMCVMCYLNVLYLEFAPIVCERLGEQERWPRLAGWARWAHGKLKRVMFLLIIAGCVLSCLHQSSLGNLLVIAPSKLHPLWWSPFSPLFFLLSAIAVGFPMVIWESLFAGWSLKLKPEMDVLGALARYVPWLLGLYLALKIGDMVHRGTYIYLGHLSVPSVAWLTEISLGVVAPMVLLSLPAVRRSPGRLFAAVSLVIGGILLNRIDVFLVGYHPPYATRTYWPSLNEWAVTIGLIAMLMLIYRLAVTYLPVIAAEPKAVGDG